MKPSQLDIKGQYRVSSTPIKTAEGDLTIYLYEKRLGNILFLFLVCKLHPSGKQKIKKRSPKITQEENQTKHTQNKRTKRKH